MSKLLLITILMLALSFSMAVKADTIEDRVMNEGHSEMIIPENEGIYDMNQKPSYLWYYVGGVILVGLLIMYYESKKK